MKSAYEAYGEIKDVDMDWLPDNAAQAVQDAWNAYMAVKAAKKERQKAAKEAGDAGEETRELKARLEELQAMRDEGLLNSQEHNDLATKAETRLKEIRRATHGPAIADRKIEQLEKKKKAAQQKAREAVRQETLPVAEELAMHMTELRKLHARLEGARRLCQVRKVPQPKYLSGYGTLSPSFKSWPEKLENYKVTKAA